MSEDGVITVKYLFFKYDYYFKDKSRKKSSSARKSKKDKVNKKDQNYIKKHFKENGIQDGLTQLVDIIKVIFQKVFKLLSNAEITKLELFAEFSEGDAAQTAITYGGVCAFLYPVLGWINAIYPVKKQNIDVHTVYTDEKVLNFRFEAVLCARAVNTLGAVFSLLWSLLKNMIKNKNNTTKKG